MKKNQLKDKIRPDVFEYLQDTFPNGAMIYIPTRKVNTRKKGVIVYMRAGLNQKDTAKMLGITPQRVGQIWREYQSENNLK